MTQQTRQKTVKKTGVKNNFEPTKMALAISALAAVSLVLLGVLAMYN